MLAALAGESLLLRAGAYQTVRLWQTVGDQ
jgi:hypothetical protein